jgi:hypothetical protein
MSGEWPRLGDRLVVAQTDVSRTREPLEELVVCDSHGIEGSARGIEGLSGNDGAIRARRIAVEEEVHVAVAVGPFCQGFPGSIAAVLIPAASSQRRTARDTRTPDHCQTGGILGLHAR